MSSYSPTARIRPSLTATAEANSPPTAEDDNDEMSVAENDSITIDVIANDNDVDGNLDPTTVTVESGPTDGVTSVEAGGSITYTPDTGFSGDDTFTYQVCDTFDACDIATVTITVKP